VVTSFEYRLHPVGQLLAGFVVFPRDRAPDLLRFHREFLKAAPDELNTVLSMATSEDGVPVVGVAVCFNGDLANGEDVLRPLREFGAPLADDIRPRTYHETQLMLTEISPPGRRNFIKTGFVRDLTDDAIETIVERFASAPSPLTFTYFTQLGNAVARRAPTATAFSHRDALCEWGCLSVWLDSADDDVNVRWTRELADAMAPHTTGAYVNQMEADETTESMRAAYGATYDRLARLKSEFDPTNMFRQNPTVRPAASHPAGT
jgi:FAD/FMN-containing dehydrogenase